MSVGFSSRREPPPPLDTPIWTMVKDRRRITAWTRVSSEVDGVEILYTLDGELLHSMRYRDQALARVKSDVDAKRAELEARGWQFTGDAT